MGESKAGSLFEIMNQFAVDFGRETGAVREGVIRGIRIQISASELRTILKERAVWHLRRSVWAAKMAKETNTSIKGMERGGISASNVTGNPRQMAEQTRANFESQARSEADAAAWFKFMSEHIPNIMPHKVFELTEADVQRLELNKRNEKVGDEKSSKPGKQKHK